MTSSSATQGMDRRTSDKRITLAFAAIVGLIIVGLIAFDQIVASVAVYVGLGSLTKITGTPLPRNFWLIALFNILLVTLFLFLTPVRIKDSWKSHGTYVAFMVSLFSEMFGFPLTVYFLSSVGYAVEPQFIGYVFLYGQLIGSPLVIIGLILIYKGWKEIVFKRGTVLVTEGIYTVVRHPQYLGFLLVTLGQFVVWPTIPTAIMWPLLAVLYYRQAKREEAVLLEAFGVRFQAYADKTPMFLPRIRVRRRPKPTSP
ncbi:MAG: isoprenylcysteine carboxylmethyltransferase family protein [Methanobacteriota archaeon]|nr:MAG: isoprenylcysteine carboxylmethyltransferase family protein [Euryarchaeota archaeon]TLZ80884.1 MAG: isoprenylcysteine carboxylmethyltransferase family protein [Euryarchaeota archaeon]